MEHYVVVSEVKLLGQGTLTPVLSVNMHCRVSSVYIAIYYYLEALLLVCIVANICNQLTSWELARSTLADSR